jgi:hypothetical protein
MRETGLQLDQFAPRSGPAGASRSAPCPQKTNVNFFTFGCWVWCAMTLQSGTNGNANGDENPPASDQSFVESELSLGRLPPKSERLKDSDGLKISKLCGDSDWQPRFVAITAERIIIAHPGHDEISDQIPLVLVVWFNQINMSFMLTKHLYLFSPA